MALTKNDIFSAADQLVAAGKQPTLNDVRKIVGGGSFTTISDAMKEWKEQQRQQAQAATPIQEPAPEEVTGHLSALAAEIWSVAREKANARLAAEREALEQARAATEQAAAEAGELADSLSADLEAANKTIEAVNAQLAAAGQRHEADVQALQKAEIIASERAQQVEAARAKERDAEERAARLESKLDAANQGFDAAESGRKKALEELESTKETVIRGQERLEYVHTQLNEKDRAIARAEDQAQEANRRADEANNRADKTAARADAEIERLRAELAQVKADATKAKEAAEKAVHAAAEESKKLSSELEAAKMEIAKSTKGGAQ